MVAKFNFACIMVSWQYNYVMRKLLFMLMMIMTPLGVSANLSFVDQQKAVIGQLLIIDAFKRTTEDKNTKPSVNLEQTFKDFNSSHKICYRHRSIIVMVVSPQD